MGGLITKCQLVQKCLENGQKSPQNLTQPSFGPFALLAILLWLLLKGF